MKLSDFDFALPESLVATSPASPRDHSRLLSVDRQTGEMSHHHFFDVGKFLRPGDLLVVNNTKVLPARLFGTDDKERKFELLLLKSSSPLRWECLIRPGKKVKTVLEVHFAEGVSATVERHPDFFVANFSGVDAHAFLPWLERYGLPPLPPYIKREATASDVASYQTVYAREQGSVAAPTAGLHFTEPLLESLRTQGVSVAEVTLHVGYGTFSSIKVEDIQHHTMHEETFSVPSDLRHRLRETRRAGHRVIAVGTTSLRALESFQDDKLSGNTRLFITPGDQIRTIDGLITNFHLPQSTLFILVSAFLGLEKTQACYARAIAEKYRFFSYGDAMVIL